MAVTSRLDAVVQENTAQDRRLRQDLAEALAAQSARVQPLAQRQQARERGGGGRPLWRVL